MLALCLASAGSASAAGALTWTASKNVDAARTIETIDCPTPSFCLAGDLSGFVVASSDPENGASWVATQLPGAGVISDVSCPSTALCLAVEGSNVWWSTDPGAAVPTWTSANVAGSVQLETLDCPSTTLCLAGAGSDGLMYSTVAPTNPSSWASVVIDSTLGIFSLDCPTTTFCVAGHDSFTAPPGPGVYITTNPTTAVPGDWVNTDGFNVDPFTSGAVTTGMSCPTVSFCVGSDDFGNVMPSSNPTGGTTAWSAPHLANFGFVDISCPTTTLCVTGAGTTWYTSVDPTGGAATWQTDLFGSALGAVACADATFCVAGGSNGNVYVGKQALLSVATAGAGTGSVSGSGIACPGTCSSAYPFTTSEVLTATPAAGSVFSGWSGDCSGTDKCNVTMSSDRAVSATFDPAPTAPVVATTSTEPPTAQPQAQPAQALPPPVERKTANTYPASGNVRVKLPGSTKFVPLAQPLQVPFGAIFDTRKGAVRIDIANRRGGTDSAVFSQGVFRLVAVGRFAELRLAGGSFRRCPKAARGGAATARSTRGRRVRRLWGEGSGSFRTKGRFASATIRGTKWLTSDYCRGTLVRVTVGAVTVRNLVTRRARALKAPRSYFARPR